MRNIAVLAHDKKKPDLVLLLKEVEDWLWQRTILATGRTAEFLEQEDFKVPVKHLSPGKTGGYIEITEMIKQKKAEFLIFLRDHEVTHNHEDIQNLLIACNKGNVPMATNPASAKLLILGLIHMEKGGQRKNS